MLRASALPPRGVLLALRCSRNLGVLPYLAPNDGVPELPVAHLLPPGGDEVPMPGGLEAWRVQRDSAIAGCHRRPSSMLLPSSQSSGAEKRMRRLHHASD
jgi:hypothetical protein